MNDSPSTYDVAVVFDMDGVLVDSTEAHYVAWSRLGEEIGVPCPRELFEETFGMHNQQIIPKWLGDHLDDKTIGAYSSRKEAFFRDVVGRAFETYPGVTELIRALADDGFGLAIGSSGPRPNVELILRMLGVEDLFTAMSTGDDVRHGKPHPEVFLKAAAKLALDPSRCIVVEDAVPGVEAARAAGAKVVAVTNTRAAADLAGADRVVECLSELEPADFRALLVR